WAPSEEPWAMAQTWDDLLFAHYRVAAEELARLVPQGLEIEQYDGSAWLGVTPFVITGFRLRGTLPLPRLSTFPELNVRTYVTVDDKPGIWFFSLDTSSLLAVEAPDAFTSCRTSRLGCRSSGARAGSFAPASGTTTPSAGSRAG